METSTHFSICSPRMGLEIAHIVLQFHKCAAPNSLLQVPPGRISLGSIPKGRIAGHSDCTVRTARLLSWSPLLTTPTPRQMRPPHPYPRFASFSSFPGGVKWHLIVWSCIFLITSEFDMFVNFGGFLFPNCMFTYFALFLKIRFALFFLIFRNSKCWSVINFRHRKYLLFRFSNFVRSVFSLIRNPPLGIYQINFCFVCVCVCVCVWFVLLKVYTRLCSFGACHPQRSSPEFRDGYRSLCLWEIMNL